jgi:sugar lactone lactonase YvrE
LDLTEGCAINGDTVLLQKWLDIPDGVCVSADGQWIAVSNHKMCSVLLYENDGTLDETSDPVCILRSIYYPHGLTFTGDGQYLLAADAGSPFVHVYRKAGSRWQGVHNPLTSFRVLDQETFLRGHHNPMEGGPKGLAIDSDHNIFVTTNEYQNLAFFDLTMVLDDAETAGGANHDGIDAYRLGYELEVQREIQDKVSRTKAAGDQRLAALTNSLSWKVTAPLRGVMSALGRLRGD